MKSKKVIINLGCGKTRIPDSIGVDLVKIDGFVDIVHDFNKTPYPFKDNYADEIHMYHVLEHLDKPIEKIEEIHRILKPNGLLHIRVPNFSSMGAFTDITHVRPFGYFSFDPFEKDHPQHYYTKVQYEIVSKEIKYFGLYPNKGTYEKYIHRNQCPKILRPLVVALNLLINLNPMLFERLWCYWVGGAIEISIILQKKA